MVDNHKKIILISLLIVSLNLICENNPLPNNQIVILFHGIRGNAKELSQIEEFLRTKKYNVYNIEYSSTKHNIQQISENIISPQIDKIIKDNPSSTINFVTHSMGGIVLRYYLQQNSIQNLGKVVMITPPNNGSEVTEWFKNIFIYKWRYGISGQQLGYDMMTKVGLKDSVQFSPGIIAGKKTQLPFFSWFIKGKDDGKISVARTKIKGMKDFIVLPYAHDNIIYKEEVFAEIISFLETSNFTK